MGVTTGNDAFEVVWPRGRSTYETVAPTERLPDPSGRRIGFIWDYLFRGDEMFQVIERELSDRFPGISFVPYETFGNVHSQDEDLALELLPGQMKEAEVDAVIVGVGA